LSVEEDSAPLPLAAAVSAAVGDNTGRGAGAARVQRWR